jgi:hypothetical protein
MKRFKMRLQPFIKHNNHYTLLEEFTMRVRDNNQARLDSLDENNLTMNDAREVALRTQLMRTSKLVKLYNSIRIFLATHNEYCDYDKLFLNFKKLQPLIIQNVSCKEYDLLYSVLIIELVYVTTELEEYFGYSDEYLKLMNRMKRKLLKRSLSINNVRVLLD